MFAFIVLFVSSMTINPFSIAYIASALIAVGLMVFLFVKRKESLSTYVYMLLTCTAVWSFFYGLELGSSNSEDIRFYVQIEYAGICLLPVFYLFYILEYTGREKHLNTSLYPLFFIIPLSSSAM